jgi:hypothetical protein
MIRAEQAWNSDVGSLLEASASISASCLMQALADCSQSNALLSAVTGPQSSPLALAPALPWSWNRTSYPLL